MHKKPRGNMHKKPDIDQLVACARAMALAMGQAAPREEDARAFLCTLLYKRHAEGGKDAWASITSGLITEVESRSLVMEHCATWLSRVNGCDEPSCNLYVTDELDACFEQALFGRRAVPVPGVDYTLH
jgi:hypothetical protein